MKIKKSIIAFSVIFIVVIIVITMVILKQPIYKSTYENYAWEPTHKGYIIYFDGTVKEFDKFDKNRELKKAKINKEELKELKNLSNQIEDAYTSIKGAVYDAGTWKEEIYSKRLGKWITLSKTGDSNGKNNSEISNQILELTEKLEEEYLNGNNNKKGIVNFFRYMNSKNSNEQE